MDKRKFDDLTRTLALGKSRRTVIKGLFGGVVGTIAVAGRPAYGALAQDACTTDDDCLEDEICCAGFCRAIECCIDDEDPNARCPEGTSCFEGVCDPLLGCGSDDDCAGDEICCEGVCAAIECCMGDADPNARCPEGTSCFEGYCDELCDIVGCGDGECCCADGKSCSSDCCETPIDVLPATGSGTTSDGGAWVAAAAVGGAAAYLAARKIRTPESDTV
jgi:LPXTG-motif cell wall-anchored protein